MSTADNLGYYFSFVALSAIILLSVIILLRQAFNHKVTSRSRINSRFILLSFVVLNYALYLQLGTPSAISHYYQPDIKADLIKNKRIRPLHAKLQNELIKHLATLTLNDTDLNAWWGVAKIYEIKGEYAHAADAWHNLYQLSNNFQHLISWLQMDIKANNGTLTTAAYDFATKITSQFIAEPAFINLLLIHHYNNKEYATALEYLKRLEELIDLTSNPEMKMQLAGLTDLMLAKKSQYSGK